MISATGLLGGHAYFLHWGVIQISLANLIVIVADAGRVRARAARAVPARRDDDAAADEEAADDQRLTDRDRAAGRSGCGPGSAAPCPPGQLLPDRQPAYVRSWIYVFGVATLAALAVRRRPPGSCSPLKGATWWHTSSVGHFVNSTHLWSVELFFAFMVIHLWGKFFMAAWRGKRGLTWVTGAVAFLGSIGTAFTGYLSQSNFDSQWISAQAKDGLNAVGIGAVLQRARHRADAALARRAAAAASSACSSCCT